MFDRIVGHRFAIKQLTRTLAEGILPHALLISGPAVCGKFTVAMEIARALNCGDTGAAECECPNCVATARLSHPGIAIAGDRYFAAEIGRAFEVARAHNDHRALQLLVCVVRKCIKRLDDRFFFHPNNKHQRKLLAGAAKIEEELRSIELAMRQQPDSDALAAHYAAIESEVATIIPLLPQQIAVNTIRAIRKWMYEPLTGALDIAYKIIIIENADQLSEASANAMLKTVEETPEQVILIFLTAHTTALLPTLRSRVREFALHQRTIAQESEVIRDVFRYSNSEPISLFEFIHTHSEFHRSIYGVAMHAVTAIEQHGTLYALIRELDGVIGNKNFGGQEVNILFYAIRKKLMERWQERNHDRYYTHFARHAFDILETTQRSITTLHFSIRDLALTTIIDLKKSYDAIH